MCDMRALEALAVGPVLIPTRTPRYMAKMQFRRCGDCGSVDVGRIHKQSRVYLWVVRVVVVYEGGKRCCYSRGPFLLACGCVLDGRGGIEQRHEAGYL